MKKKKEKRLFYKFVVVVVVCLLFATGVRELSLCKIYDGAERERVFENDRKRSDDAVAS